MTTVIKIDNLSKKYAIRHVRRERYQTLRDVIISRIKNIAQRRLGIDREEFWALKNISLEVKEGERVAIIGRNGSGKSTLLKIISRITEPTTGVITLFGNTASLLEVGTGFHPELTGRENIYLNGAILGMSRFEIEDKFDEIVEFSEIGNFLDTPVKRFSSGMQMRLAFSVAAHLEPDILIIDEVLAVGDYQFQKKCLGKMDEVAREGRTIFFVSHNLELVQQLCNRVIILSQGEKIYDGDIENGISVYLENVESQRFIDTRTLIRPRHIIGDAIIATIEFLNNPKLLYQMNDPIQLQICIKGNNSVDQFFLKVILMNTDGKPLGMAVGIESLSVKQGEEISCRVVFHTPDLVPGRYMLGFLLSGGLFNSKRATQDYLKSVASFDIHSPNEQVMVWDQSFGSVRLENLEIDIK